MAEPIICEAHDIAPLLSVKHEKPIYALYRFTFPDGRLYFGISRNLALRWYMHDDGFRANRSLKRLGGAIRRAGGLSKIQKDVLVVGPEQYIRWLECRMIAEFRTTDHCLGFNTQKGWHKF